MFDDENFVNHIAFGPKILLDVCCQDRAASNVIAGFG